MVLSTQSIGRIESYVLELGLPFSCCVIFRVISAFWSSVPSGHIAKEWDYQSLSLFFWIQVLCSFHQPQLPKSGWSPRFQLLMVSGVACGIVIYKMGVLFWEVIYEDLDGFVKGLADGSTERTAEGIWNLNSSCDPIPQFLGLSENIS